MLEPSEPVPSIRLPKNRNAMRKSGIARASAIHGISICEVSSSGTMPMPAASASSSQTRDLEEPRAAEPEQLARENLVGIGRGEQHLDDLVLFLRGGALHQVSGGHQHRHQEEHHEDERHREADRCRRLPSVGDLPGPRHAEPPGVSVSGLSTRALSRRVEARRSSAGRE